MSTSSIRKRSIQWSPHNKSSFVVGSNDLRLYNFKYTDNKENKEPQSPVNNNNNNNINNNNNNINNNNNNNISPRLRSSKYMETYNFDIEYPPDDWEPVEKKTISLVSINSDVQLMKCMSWCPDQSDQNLIACGLTSGRAILTSFSSVNRVLKELVPKHTRSCNAIAWNPIYTNQLAVGLDKVRGDSSTLIWDINYLQSINNKQSNFYNQQNNNNNNITNRSPTNSNSNNNNNGNVDQPYPMPQISDNSFSTSTEYSDTIYQPISEFTQSESTLALAWLPNNPSCLLVGTGSKWLKLYDIRDTNNSQSVMAHQKSVNGVCVDPFDCNRIATNSEDSNIKIWDLRQLDDPIMIVNSNCKSIQQIDWCPTRSGVLASVGKDKATVKLWDVKAPFSNSDLNQQQSSSNTINKSPKLEPSKSSSSSTLSSQLKSNSTTINISSANMNNININSSGGVGGSGSKDNSGGNKDGNHDNVNTISKPTKTHHSSEIISSFSWHPTNECRMLTVSFSGVIEVVSLNENIPISWSPHGALCFSFGNNVLEGPSKGQSLEPNLENFKNLTNDGRYEKDISLKIRERAIQGYSANVEENINLSNKINDESINFLWNWIKKTPIQISNFKKDTITTSSASTATTNSNNEFIGIYNILIEKDVSTVEPSNGFLIYKSPNRNLCLSICGWGFNQNLPLENILSRLEKQGEYERAAAIAVFHLDIKRAILVLTNACYNIHPVHSTNHHGHVINRDREFNFKVLSIALSGFDGNIGGGGNGNSTWKETCKSTARSSFSNQPYLKTCLEFLSSSAESKEIHGIIEDSKISLDDKIAFSCKYLDYQDLIHFVERNTIRVIECGNLIGVLLTGLTGRGVDLFSNYIDRTCDIQTAALAMTLVVPKTFRDKRVAKWYSIYSDLLDTWELWHQRAILDIQRVSTGSSNNSGSVPNTPTSTSTPSGTNIGNSSGSNSGNNSINSSANSNAANNTNSNDLFPLQPQIFAKCGFCQNSFSFESVSVSSMVGRNASKPNFKAKVPFCPHCKQSLPRCCLCLLPLNCMVPTPDFKKGGILPPPQHHGGGSNIPHSHTTVHQPHNNHTSNTDNSQFWSQGSESFEDWFTWCQTCRHGGHSQHILDWFKDHTTCPVTSCECRCSQL